MADTTQAIVEDSMLPRDRKSRWLVLVLTLAVCIMIPGYILQKIWGDWFGLAFYGRLIGFGLGAMFFAGSLLPRMIVRVKLNHAFVTIDLLRALLKREKVYVAYGPGTHISFPWEERLAGNNVSLEEASQDFVFAMMVRDGKVMFRGSIRLRPKFGTDELVIFLGGVASIASEVLTLIESKISEVIRDMSVTEVRESLKIINEKLHADFAHTTTKPETQFETRFGVVVGDVTIGSVGFDADLEKTISGLAEAQTIARGTALTMGYVEKKDGPSAIEQMRKDKDDGKITQADIDRARDRYLAVSNNIKMQLDSNEYIVTVVADPEVARAIAEIAPILAPMVGRAQKKGK